MEVPKPKEVTTKPIPDTLTASPGLPETLVESDIITATAPKDPLAHAPPSKLIEPPQLKFASVLQASKAQDGKV